MTNVIRPKFGRLEVQDQPEVIEGYSPLRVYGTAVGHIVGLIRADAGLEGPALHVIVGMDGSGAAEVVATLPDTAACETDAETIAFAILRSLEIVREALVGSASV